jgi:hypothetical protein
VDDRFQRDFDRMFGGTEVDNTYETLRRLVSEMYGPPGWSFDVVDKGPVAALMIHVSARDNYDANQRRTTSHEHLAPPASYNEKTWRRWIFDRCLASMAHEMGEQVRWGDIRPFAPTHGPGEDPYTVREYRDPIDVLTTQYGRVRVAHGSQDARDRSNLSQAEADRLRREMWEIR